MLPHAIPFLLAIFDSEGDSFEEALVAVRVVVQAVRSGG